MATLIVHLSGSRGCSAGRATDIDAVAGAVYTSGGEAESLPAARDAAVQTMTAGHAADDTMASVAGAVSRGGWRRVSQAYAVASTR